MLRFVFVIALINLSFTVFGVDLNTDKVNCSLNSSECKTCPYETEESGSNSCGKAIGLATIIGLTFYYFFSVHKKKFYLYSGAVLIIVLLSSSFYYSPLPGENSISVSCLNNTDDFHSAGDEFEDASEDEFKSSGDEFSGSTDEFQETDSNTNEFNSTKEQSSPDAGDFNSISGEEFSTSIESSEVGNKNLFEWSDKDKAFLIELAFIFLLIVTIGFFIQYSFIQQLRPFFLLGMLIWLGFLNGGCPCIISSFQNLILFFTGIQVNWMSLLWFLGLLPLTYLFGRIWCGWLCHLGALQEFLFSASRMEFLKSRWHQKILKIIQVSVLIILVGQLIITKSNIFVHYDPFKVAFNLYSASLTGYVLLVLLLVSSILIYRPFCRAICPVGLLLGVVAKVPGAKSMKQLSHCVDCKSCSNECKSQAIIYEEKRSEVNIVNCIACGNCMDSCKKEALVFSLKNENNEK